MKNLLLIVLFGLLNFSLCSSQEYKIVEADTTWGREIIHFPIEWTPKMNVVGFEELRFAPQWDNVKSNDFWSLVMAWKLNMDSSIAKKNLEHNITAYFDGLMKPNHWSQDFPEPSLTLTVVTEAEDSASYKGTLTIFDGFHTGEVVTLNTTIETFFDAEEKTAIVLIRFSPQAYTDPIWKSLNAISLYKNTGN